MEQPSTAEASLTTKVIQSNRSRLEAVQRRLREAGVQDVKFTWSENIANMSSDDVMGSVASYMEAYLDGKTKEMHYIDGPLLGFELDDPHKMELTFQGWIEHFPPVTSVSLTYEPIPGRAAPDHRQASIANRIKLLEALSSMMMNNRTPAYLPGMIEKTKNDYPIRFGVVEQLLEGVPHLLKVRFEMKIEEVVQIEQDLITSVMDFPQVEKLSMVFQARDDNLASAIGSEDKIKILQVIRVVLLGKNSANRPEELLRTAIRTNEPRQRIDIVVDDCHYYAKVFLTFKLD